MISGEITERSNRLCANFRIVVACQRYERLLNVDACSTQLTESPDGVHASQPIGGSLSLLGCDFGEQGF